MDKKDWFVKNYRRNLVDMHIEEWDESFMSKFDPRNYVDMLKKANIAGAMIYANSHVGPCYWPTKQGHMHKGLKGRDILGETLDLAHKSGMDVIVYYSLIYDNMAYDMDPKWRMVNKDGLASREINQGGDFCFGGSRYGNCCPNSQGYREFTYCQLEDICENYSFEGVFFDMNFWPTVCYCESCAERYMRETGCELPREIDWADSKWLKFQQKREEWMTDFAMFTTGAVKQFKPDVSCNHQFSSMTSGWMRGVISAAADAVDYAGGDFYGGVAQQSFVCKLFHEMTGSFEFHTSRCTDLLDHTTLKHSDEIALNHAIAMAHNGAFLFIDAIDPEGTLNPEVYEAVGCVLKKAELYEPHLGGRMIADVAVYFSTQSKMDLKDVKNLFGIQPHVKAASSASERLRGAHIPHTVITERNINDLLRFKAIILSDVIFMSEEEVSALSSYVKNGGSLLISGEAGVKYFGDLLNVKAAGKTEESVTYVSPTPKGFLSKLLDEKYPLTVFFQQCLADYDGEAEAYITLPFTRQTEMLRFASIHSNPPGKRTHYPSVIKRQYGEGLVLWSAAVLENYETAKHIEVFNEFLRLLDPEPSFMADTHKAFELVVFEQDGGFIVNCLNLQNSFPLIPLYNSTVKLFVGAKVPKRIVRISDGAEIPWEMEAEYVVFPVERLDYYEMYKIETENATVNINGGSRNVN